MNLLTVPAQAIPHHRGILAHSMQSPEHKRAIKCKSTPESLECGENGSPATHLLAFESACSATRMIKANGHFHHAKKKEF
jgi:hypothetical protein